MTDRDNMTAMQATLTKEKEEFVKAIANLEQMLAQHRVGLERTDAALFVVSKLLTDGEKPKEAAAAPKTPAPHKLNGKSKGGKNLHA